MRKSFESPKVEILRFSTLENITSAEEVMSGPLDFGEDIEDF